MDTVWEKLKIPIFTFRTIFFLIVPIDLDRFDQLFTNPKAIHIHQKTLNLQNLEKSLKSLQKIERNVRFMPTLKENIEFNFDISFIHSKKKKIRIHQNNNNLRIEQKNRTRKNI